MFKNKFCFLFKFLMLCEKKPFKKDVLTALYKIHLLKTFLLLLLVHPVQVLLWQSKFVPEIKIISKDFTKEI